MADTRARALITAATGRRAALETAMRDTAGDLVWGTRIAGDPLPDTPHREALGPHAEIFDLFVEAASADAVAAVLAPLAPLVDPARSAVIAGPYHLLMPWQGPYLMIFALRPRVGMSRADFLDYWTTKHGPLIVAAGRGKGSYYQLHAHPGATTTLARTLGYVIDDLAGNAGGWLKEPEKLARFFHHPSTLAALADERMFIDHRRSPLNIYRIESA
ncbi:MAG: EthD domain-containing protein [Sphingobium sp.]